MRTSCIEHPGKEPMIMVRQWQIDFCEGNKCAAMLLSFYEYWHNIKLAMQGKNKATNDVAEAHGDERTQDESLYQFHTQKDLENGILGYYSKTKITEANKFLTEKGVITLHKNPNPRYAFDNTNFFLFHPDIINDWLKVNSRCPEIANGQPDVDNGKPDTDNGCPEVNEQYTETSTEITTETTSERNGSHSDADDQILAPQEQKRVQFGLSIWRDVWNLKRREKGLEVHEYPTQKEKEPLYELGLVSGYDSAVVAAKVDRYLALKKKYWASKGWPLWGLLHIYGELMEKPEHEEEPGAWSK